MSKGKRSNSENRIAENQTIETDVPARLDRLPWSRWHTRIIVALGTSWLLDGLEVTLVGSLSGVLESKSGLSFTDPQVTAAATFYLAGAVTGAILFGYLTDRLGRKKLFLVTLATYSLATIASAFSWNFLSFSIFRLLHRLRDRWRILRHQLGGGRAYPGKVRGTVDLVVNGTFWVGATIGSVAAMFLLHGHGLSAATSWRYAFGVGGSLGAAVLVLRLYVPESPRWLMLRGYEEQGKKVVKEIENKVSKGNPGSLPPPEGKKLKIMVRDHTPLKEIFRNMMGDNRQRSFLALTLMVGQAFFFNAVFFTYALVVKKFFHVSNDDLPRYLLPFAVGQLPRADGAWVRSSTKSGASR